MCPRVDRAGGRSLWMVPTLWSIALALRQRELSHAPFHQIVARNTYHGAGCVTNQAKRHHPDHYGGIAHHDVRSPNDVAEAVLPGNHLGGDQREPRHPDRDLQAGENERQRPGHHHVAEYLPTAGAEAVRSAHVGFVDRLHAEHGIERGGEERREEGDRPPPTRW